MRGVVTTLLGASGSARCVPWAAKSDQGPLPSALTARTWTRYLTSPSSPLTVWAEPSALPVPVTSVQLAAAKSVAASRM